MLMIWSFYQFHNEFHGASEKLNQVAIVGYCRLSFAQWKATCFHQFICQQGSEARKPGMPYG